MAGFGVFFLIVGVFMIVSYCLDPANIDAPMEKGDRVAANVNTKVEIILMTLLFVYITLSLSGEVAIGSE